jgi:ABC-2 type transport system ATP-binding protein
MMSAGRVVAAGTLDEVRGDSRTLEEAFVKLLGADMRGQTGLSWLAS